MGTDGDRMHASIKSSALILMVIMLTAGALPLHPLVRPRHPQAYSPVISSSPPEQDLQEVLEHLRSGGQSLPFGGFIRNLGQLDDERVEYYVPGRVMDVGFGPSMVLYAFHRPDGGRTVFRMTFPGSDTVHPTGRVRNQHVVNYFHGDLVLTNVPTYNEVWFEGLYPGIDLRFMMTGGGLKYEAIARPHSDPSVFRIQLSGDVDVEVSDVGVSVSLPGVSGGPVFTDSGLDVFQTGGASVPAEYTLIDPLTHTYGFALGEYDPSKTLIIDPWCVSHATLLGGSGGEWAYDIDVDSSGHVYVTGYSGSVDFDVTQDAYQASHGGAHDIFVTELNQTMTGLVYSTYIGGSGDDEGRSLFVDSSGNVYIGGYTASSDFPLVNAYDPSLDVRDAVVVKLDSSGQLVFSTYFGGSGEEVITGIVPSGTNYIYVVGYTTSDDLNVTSAYQDTFGGGSYDAFAAEFDTSSASLVYSTYLGGSDDDLAYDAVLIGQDVVLVGHTWSSDYPAANGYDTSINGQTDIFVTRLNSTGNGIVFSTFLGGGSYDYGQSIALDSSNNIYVAGRSMSSNFPTVSAYQDSLAGEYDVVVSELSANGQTLLASTYLGGTDTEWSGVVTVDPTGHVCVAAKTASTDYPLLNASDSSRTGATDAVLTLFDSGLSTLRFSTYFGGSHTEETLGIDTDSSGAVYFCGTSTSLSFPAHRAYQPGLSGTSDAYIVKYDVDVTPPTIGLVGTSNNTVHRSGTLIRLDPDDDMSGVQSVTYSWDGGANNSLSAPYKVALPSGETTHVLRVYVSDRVGFESSAVYSFVTDDTAPVIDLVTPTNHTSACSGTLVDVDITEPHIGSVTYTWGDSSPQAWSAPYHTVIPHENGWVTLTVNATDQAGNNAVATYVFKASASRYLHYSTYFGGTDVDMAEDLAVSTNGVMYIVGSTAGSLPTFNAYDSSFNGLPTDAFLAAFAGNGSLLFSTYIGGDDEDHAYSVALDSDGTIVVAGLTASSNFPVTSGAYQNVTNGGDEAFITRFSSSGDSLVWSTYLGGSLQDRATAVAVAIDHTVYVTGRTTSNDLPTNASSYQLALGGYSDAFVAHLTSDGQDLYFITYLGGSDNAGAGLYVDEGLGIVADTTGHCFVVGYTDSSDFPVKNANDSSLGGNIDAFVAKFASSGLAQFVTYLGGSGNDYATAVALDSSFKVYVTGYTRSTDYPTIDQPAGWDGDYDDIFVTRFTSDGSQFDRSLVIGTDYSDMAWDIAVDSSGRVFVSGQAGGPDFPLVDPVQSSHVSASDAVVMSFNSGPAGLNFSSYLGGNGDDVAHGVAARSVFVYVAGSTKSTDFPVSDDAYQGFRRGSEDSFVTRISVDNSYPSVGVNPFNGSRVKSGTDIDISVSDTFSGVSEVLVSWDTLDNSTVSAPYSTPVPLGDGTHVLNVYVRDGVGHWTSGHYVFLADNSPPVVTLATPAEGSYVRSGTTVQVSVADYAIGSVRYAWDGAALQDWPSPYVTSQPAGDGPHTLRVEASDDLGNAISVEYTLYTDDTPPSIGRIPASPSLVLTDSNKTGASLIWQGSDSYPGSYSLYLNDSLVRTNTWNATWESITVELGGLAPGVYNYTMVLRDLAGNEATDQVIVTVLSNATTTTTTTTTTGTTTTTTTTTGTTTTGPPPTTTGTTTTGEPTSGEFPWLLVAVVLGVLLLVAIGVAVVRGRKTEETSE